MAASEDDSGRRVEAEIVRLRAAIAAEQKHSAHLHLISSELVQRVCRAEAALAAQVKRTDQLASALHAIETSEAWRITATLRLLAERSPGVVRGVKRTAGLARRFAGFLPGIPRVSPTKSSPMAGAVLPLLSTPISPEPVLPPIRQQEVDIIICVHNALDDVQLCLASVKQRTLPPYTIILVDDGSDAPTRDYLRQFAQMHRAVLIRNETAEGYTRAANAGLRVGRAPMAVLLNSDTEVTEGWVDRLFDLLVRHPEAAMAGPLSNTASWQSVPRLMEGEDWAANALEPGCTVADMARMAAEGAARRGIPVGFLNGFCLMLRREALDVVGLFDEEVFGAGFGEENDLCIRLRQAGWALLVADDVYIQHRQSRSYGHERRLELAKRADAALGAKHDWAGDIAPFVLQAQNSLLLEHARQRIATAQAVRRLTSEIGPAYMGRRIGIILPAGEASGGANVIIQEAVAAARFGVDIWIFNVMELESGFRRDYPDLPLPLLCAPTDIFGIFINQIAADLKLDAVIATSSSSFDWLPPARTGLTLAYYIQDDETRFFPAGSKEHDAVIRSYSERPEVVRVTKTRWNADAVGSSCGISAPLVLGASVDLARFAPLRDPAPDDAVIHITAMVRPATPRRNPDRTIATLRWLKDRFGERVIVSCFGAPAEELAALGVKLDGIVCHGALNPARVAALLGHTDVFLDLSEWQAMGLTALEALACGAAVIVPQEGGAVEVTQDAALAVDIKDGAACEAAASRLVTEAALRRGLRQAGLQCAARFPPEQAAANLLRGVFAS